MSQNELSRRSLIRKAAYTAPTVFVIAAAPRTALGASGPPRNDRPTKPNWPTKPNNDKPTEPNNNAPAKPISSIDDNKNGNIIEPVGNGAVAQAARVSPADGEAMVRYLPNTGSGDDQMETDASKSLITATSLSLVSAAVAFTLRKHNHRSGEPLA
jgi:hypothetical protein